MKKKSFGSQLFSLILLIIIIVSLYFFYDTYKKMYFNDFIKAEHIQGTSNFIREKVENNQYSYKITSPTYNDAMFYKTIEVTPNTAYRISCMVKTKEIQTKKEISNSGACISVLDTTEMSEVIKGTNDWKQLTLCFNSKERTQIEVGFRLGSYVDDCKGEAWFKDLKLERGYINEDTNWNMVCFIFENLDVNINENGVNTNIKTSINQSEMLTIQENLERAKTSFKALSNYNMTMQYQIINIEEAIKTVSYDNENGYYVSSSDIADIIQPYIEKQEYDYIFAAVKLGDVLHKDIEGDWIGLGGMTYQNIGFSNIRLLNEEKSHIYKYSSNNTFPEEVYIHEFLHTLEKESEEYGMEIPKLHDNEKYGYEVKAKEGLKQWYADYMCKNIKFANGTTGLEKQVFTFKPTKNSQFDYSIELDFENEPENIIEEIRTIFKGLFEKIDILQKQINVQIGH